MTKNWNEQINAADTRDDLDDVIEAACEAMNTPWLTQHCCTNTSYTATATTLERIAELLRDAETRRLTL